MVKRIFVEKKQGYNVEANSIYNDLSENLGIKGISGIRLICRYDVEGMTDEQYEKAVKIVFSEPPVDNCYHEMLPEYSGRAFATEYLPGQYDQRADSAMQCIQILTCGERPKVKSAKVIICEGDVSDVDFERIKSYLINPVEAREASFEKPDNLNDKLTVPEDIEIIEDFITCGEDKLEELRKSLGLAMDTNDIIFCREYFKNTEKRNPTMTEIRMIDTYWSDHCRHTTFNTRLNNIKIEEGTACECIKNTYEDYLKTREELYVGKHKDICLMDIATIAMKKLKKQGILKNLDESEEINACSIEVDANIDGKKEKWLVMFKNETHNHPTEIEPFGGAATCLGGAIRDPLSGRSYVYQAMRVTGSGDPRTSVENTIPGKLPQRKITLGAAGGYSSYGNQIGLATGMVDEIYDEGYVAKRLEIGAVVGACPKSAVKREVPSGGDVVILLGGRTGRDGCGGATGSSKAHTEQSLESCGAEVQKGNPTEERKIQRLFRNKKITSMIKRCNDFGAGGVSVAIGELADGLYINLDAVPKKYEGLSGTELAISESQERMAVVVAESDAKEFISGAGKENLEATIVAQVTENPRLVMDWRGKTIVNISREFLNSNGAPKDAEACVGGVNGEYPETKGNLKEVLSSLEECSRIGLSERFDSTIGAGSVFMPFGGKYQLTPSECMAAKLPVLGGNTTTASVMAYGFNPKISKWSPFHGAMYAVVESAAKLVASGGSLENIYLTFQEYFERLYDNPLRWGKPLAALLGAYKAQSELGIAAIGGKDSMSGSFEELDVPPTLVSFAICCAEMGNIVSNEFKNADHKVILVETKINSDFTIDFESFKKNCALVNKLIQSKKVFAASTVKNSGAAVQIAKMSFGNAVGFEQTCNIDLYKPMYGSFILEVQSDVSDGIVLGHTVCSKTIKLIDEEYSIEELIKTWEAPLENVFPVSAKQVHTEIDNSLYAKRPVIKPQGIARPKVFIPVFPGTNCEYDTARAFEAAGANPEIFVVKNLSGADIEHSLDAMAKAIDESQIVMIPGGFSGGDEPEGSGKFIAAAFRNPYVKEAVNNLLKKRDGLMLGICNGFQALIKLGLVPYGEICELGEDSPTLTYNDIGRHMSSLVNTKVVSVKSPWLSDCSVEEIHTVAVSHGEGKFVCSSRLYEELKNNGQIATKYVDLNGNPSYDTRYNPNGSYNAVEGITSPDGRVFGKMAHSERAGDGLYKNVPGNKIQPIFRSGVKYFS